MKNKYIKYLIVLLIITVISFISFIVPIKKTAGFWISYAFYILHSFLLITILNISLDRNYNLKDKFFYIPVIRQELFIYILQIFLLFATLSIGIMPWISAIINVLLLGIALIQILLITIGKNNITETEYKVKEKNFFIKSLQTELEIIAENEKNMDVKTKLDKLAEKFKYSDPMSNEKLNDIELKLTNKVQELKETKNKAELIDEIERLLIERNKKCKILK